jgi:hypothetical protein
LRRIRRKRIAARWFGHHRIMISEAGLANGAGVDLF